MTFSTLRLRRLRALIVAKVLLFWFFFYSSSRQAKHERHFLSSCSDGGSKVGITSEAGHNSINEINLRFLFFGTSVVIKLAANCYKKVNFSTVTSPQQTSSVAFSRLNKKWCNLLCEATEENSVQAFLSAARSAFGCQGAERCAAVVHGREQHQQMKGRKISRVPFSVWWTWGWGFAAECWAHKSCGWQRIDYREIYFACPRGDYK